MLVLALSSGCSDASPVDCGGGRLVEDSCVYAGRPEQMCPPRVPTRRLFGDTVVCSPDDDPPTPGICDVVGPRCIPGSRDAAVVDASGDADARVDADARLDGDVPRDVDARASDADADAGSCSIQMCRESGYSCGRPPELCDGTFDCGRCGGTCTDYDCTCPGDDVGTDEIDGLAPAFAALTPASPVLMTDTIHDDYDRDWVRLAATGATRIEARVTTPGTSVYRVTLAVPNGCATPPTCDDGAARSIPPAAYLADFTSCGVTTGFVRMFTQCGDVYLSVNADAIGEVPDGFWNGECAPYEVSVSAF